MIVHEDFIQNNDADHIYTSELGHKWLRKLRALQQTIAWVNTDRAIINWTLSDH